MKNPQFWLAFSVFSGAACMGFVISDTFKKDWSMVGFDLICVLLAVVGTVILHRAQKRLESSSKGEKP